MSGLLCEDAKKVQHQLCALFERFGLTHNIRSYVSYGCDRFHRLIVHVELREEDMVDAVYKAEFRSRPEYIGRDAHASGKYEATFLFRWRA